MRTVTSGIDMVGKLWHRNFEARLYGSHDLLISLRGNESDRESLRSKSTGTTRLSSCKDSEASEAIMAHTQHDVSNCQHQGDSHS